MKITRLVKMCWETDKFYTILILSMLIFAVMDIIDGKRVYSALDLLLVYCCTNEIRYKYDNENKIEN